MRVYETDHASISHSLLSSDLWHYKRQAASLRFTCLHTSTHVHACTHTHTQTHTHTHTHTHWEHSAHSAVSTGSARVRGLTSGRRYGERCGGGGCFGIKLSVVGPTGDETTGEVRQLTGWDSRSLNGSLAVLNRPVSVTEDERVTERVLHKVSLISILNPLSVFHFIWTWRRVKFKSTKGWVTDFKLQRDDRS